MKKLYNYIKVCVVMLPLIASFSNAKAQLPACSTYVFTTGNETFTYLTGSTSVNLQADDITVTNIPIGFSFPFCGNYYTTVSACSNGWLSLANSSLTTYSISQANAAAFAPCILAQWGDLYGAGGGVSSYLTSGTAPNRVFTFEWKYWRPLSYTSVAEMSFQVRLYEGTGRIQTIHKREGSNPMVSEVYGIMYSNADYQTLPNTGTSPIPSSTVFNVLSSTYPANGQVYTWDPPTPCPKSTALTINTYNSQGATFSWTGVSGAIGYDYAVDTKQDIVPALATPITTTAATNGSANGLTPSTLYYLHVRTRCSATGISYWDTVSFMTLPPCRNTTGFLVSYIDSNSANFQWTPNSNVLQYQYVVDLTRNAPLSSTALNTTTTSFVSLPDTCKDGTLYYVHIRSKCVSNDSSGWSLDSFRTPVPCRRPLLMQSYMSSSNSIIYWNPVPTAVSYEYYLGPLTSLPPNGTPILTTTIQTPYLVPNTNYTMSVRCNCTFYGINTQSAWASLDFTTPHPESVGGFITPKVNIEIYPNPVKESLHIVANGLKGKTATAQVTDMNGRVVKTLNLDTEVTEVNMGAVPAGVYLLKYQDADQAKVLKFTKE